MNWPWSVGKRKAMAFTIGYVVAACVLLWVTAANNAQGSCLMFWIALVPAGLYGWRWHYLHQRDTRNAQLSRSEVVYHAHEAAHPTPKQHVNRLYIPQERKH